MRIITVAIAAFLYSSILHAQSQKSLVEIAIEAGKVAGSARYCQADPDKVEAFISRIQGTLGSQARDDVEKVLLNVEFKNQLTAASAKQPAGGCKVFLQNFERIIRDVF